MPASEALLAAAAGGAGLLFWVRALRRRTVRAAGDADSARREAQTLRSRVQELEASRSQMEGILQSMREGVVVVDPAGNLLLINQAAREILGLGPGIGPGRSFAECVRHPDLQELVRQVLQTQEPQVRELILYSPVECFLQVQASSCRYPPAGSCALVVFHDVTHFKKLEQVRRDFVANVSHELKTPLTAIRAAAETLLDGAIQDADYGRVFLETISEETTRLHRLVDDLLTLARVESRQTALNKERVPVGLFLEELTARYRPLAKTHGVSLELEQTPEVSLLADRSQLAQAVSNLLENAIKYNRPDGRVVVRARESDGTLVLEVEDTGIGIPPEDMPRIFERFYRVDKARSRETGGTGLGLSIVKHVAEVHGGSVEVESRPGSGSRFTLILPLR